MSTITNSSFSAGVQPQAGGHLLAGLAPSSTSGLEVKALSHQTYVGGSGSGASSTASGTSGQVSLGGWPASNDGGMHIPTFDEQRYVPIHESGSGGGGDGPAELVVRAPGDLVYVAGTSGSSAGTGSPTERRRQGFHQLQVDGQAVLDYSFDVNFDSYYTFRPARPGSAQASATDFRGAQAREEGSAKAAFAFGIIERASGFSVTSSQGVGGGTVHEVGALAASQSTVIPGGVHPPPQAAAAILDAVTTPDGFVARSAHELRIAVRDLNRHRDARLTFKVTIEGVAGEPERTVPGNSSARTATASSRRDRTMPSTERPVDASFDVQMRANEVDRFNAGLREIFHREPNLTFRVEAAA